MKLHKLLMLLADNERIHVYDESSRPTENIFTGTVIECYEHPKILKRKVTYFFSAHYEMVIFVK